MMESLRSNFLTAVAVIGLGLLVLATQLRGLGTEVYNWDEHTFMLMAQDVLRGHLPYFEQFDNKPPGMFLLLAGAMALFGENLLVTRALGDAGILLIAAMLFGMLQGRIGTWAAFLVGAMTIAAFATVYGFYTSVELVSIVFITAAMWLMVLWGERRWTGVLVGLMICCAVLIRSNLGLVAVAIGGLYLVALWRPAAVGLHRAGVVGYVIGGLTPVAVLIAVYAAHGGLNLLYVSTVPVAISYAFGQKSAWTVAKELLSGLVSPDVSGLWSLRLFWIIVAVSSIPALAIFDRGAERHDQRRLALLAAVVSVATAISILVGGVSNLRFVIQLFPGAALLVGIGIAAQQGWVRRGLLAACAMLAVSTTAISLPKTVDVMVKAEAKVKAYPMRRAAAAIAADRGSADRVWALRSHLVLFYLDEPPLSWIATHPDSIDRAVIAEPLIEAGLVPADEFSRILASRPRYIVTEERQVPAYLTTPHEEALAAVLDAEYRVWRHYGPVWVMRRRGKFTGPALD